MDGNSENAFIRLIQNELLVELIAKKMDFRELQAVTLASKDCLSCFRNTKSFSNRVRFTIKGERPSGASSDDDDNEEEVDISEPLQVFQRSTYDWKNVSIELGVPDLLLDHDIAETEHRLRSVKSILFYSSHLELRDAKVLADWLHFEPMLERMENLEELKVHSMCVMYKERPFTSGGLFQQIFRKLESLKLTLCSTSDNYSLWRFQANLQPGDFQPKKFYLAPPELSMMGDVGIDVPLNVAKIVDAMRDTLQELQLHYDYDVFEGTQMKTMRFPNLKSLLLRISNWSEWEGVETFLQNQVPLEVLRIRTEDFPLHLLEHLQEAGKLGNLKKLCIQAFQLHPRDSWTFLRGMRELKVVHLTFWRCYNEYCSSENESYLEDAKSFKHNLKIMMTGLRELYPRIKFIECCQSSCDNCGVYERSLEQWSFDFPDDLLQL